MDLGLAKLPWHAQIGAFLALAAAAAGVYYSYYELPAQAEMSVREGQLKALRADVDQGRLTASTLAEVRGEVEVLERRLDGHPAALPEESDLADLLRRMQTVAAQSNLTIKSFKPAPIAARAVNTEWPIALELDGTYHSLATFFDRLGKFTRVVNVSDLDVKGKDKPAANSTITATCVATTLARAYVQAPGGSAETGPGAGTPPKGLPPPYTCNVEGRRDPFLGHVPVRVSAGDVLNRGEGAARYAVGEISVRGVMQSGGLFVAMVQGPDKKTYIVHSGDKLADGVVKSVTPQGLLIIQNAGGSLSALKQREVRKLVRSLEVTNE